MGMALHHALALLLVLLPLAVVTTAYTIKQKDGGSTWDHCSSDKLAVTTAYTIKPKDGGFGSWDYCSSDNLTTHSILQWGPKSDDHGKDILFSYPHVPHNFIDLDKNDDGKDFLFGYAHVAHNFIALDMSGCHAGACGASETRRGLVYRKK